MKQIKIFDTTLCEGKSVFGFKEKLEIIRQLDKLFVDVIELPEIEDVKADTLLVRTAASFVKNSVLSVAAGFSPESVKNAILALNGSKKGRIRIELPMSPAGMEYIAKKKPEKMIVWVEEAIKQAKQAVEDVEFCAVDATRAEEEFLNEIVDRAVAAGAVSISLCDSADEMLPDDFVSFVSKFAERIKVPVGVKCVNGNGLAAASSVLSVRNGAEYIKVDVDGVNAPLCDVATMLKNCGNRYGFSANIKQTELFRIIKQISWVTTNAKDEKSVMTVSQSDENEIHLDANDDQATVISAVSKLGYDLSEDDQKKVYEEFLRLAAKKRVSNKDLDAIVASIALQVPATFKLLSYVINNGNIISSSAQISVEKAGVPLQGICIGDGPIDAAFRAIDQIIGHHYELDDFQIQSVTEGKEAMGSALVKLRAGGKLYSGNGISTDIIGASIRAYLNAVNKIVYEEA
ncbi:MAG: hypothetical protein IKU24_00415 [Clostridia bacterium]|nr:hypothetical protein [Clostridia bacterium]